MSDEEKALKEKRKAINVPMGDWNLEEIFQLLALVQRSPVIPVSKEEYIQLNEKIVATLENPSVKDQIAALKGDKQ